MDKLGKRRVVDDVLGFNPGARLDEILKQAEEKIKQLEGLNQQEYQKALQDYSSLLGDLRGYARGQAASAMLGNIAQNPYTQAILKQQGLADAARKAKRIPQYFLDVQRAEAESQMNAMANEMLASGARPSEVASVMAPYYDKMVGQQNDLAMKVYASNAAADADYYSFLTNLQNENIASDVQNRNAILAALNKKIATSADIGTDLLRNLAALRTMETNLPRSAAQSMYENEMNLLRTRLGLDRDRIGVDIYKEQEMLEERRRAEARALDEQRRADAAAARAEQERKRKEEEEKRKTDAEAAKAEKDMDNKLTTKPPSVINNDEDDGSGGENIDENQGDNKELPKEPFNPELLPPENLTVQDTNPWAEENRPETQIPPQSIAYIEGLAPEQRDVLMNTVLDAVNPNTEKNKSNLAYRQQFQGAHPPSLRGKLRKKEIYWDDQYKAYIPTKIVHKGKTLWEKDNDNYPALPVIIQYLKQVTGQ